MFLSDCNGASSPTEIKIENQDTVCIIVDSSSIKDNVYEYVLIIKTENHTYEIYREKSIDNSIEFEYSGSYQTSKLSLDLFNITDLPTGQTKAIIHDKSLNIFYLTSWYDSKALGDSLIKSTVDFKKLNAQVKSLNTSYSDYEVNLTKIWEPTEEYKKKTIIK